MTSGTLWRYTAIELDSPAHKRRGELAGSTAADVRASLRRIGLQVIELKPITPSRTLTFEFAQGLLDPFTRILDQHVRNRRRAQRAELYDSLSTMLRAGLPLLETIQTLIESSSRSSGKAGSLMLAHLREQLRAGQSLGQAMTEHPRWFDGTDVAIVEAGQHSGTLSAVLASMADRQEKAGELGHKLIGALAYPFMVLLVGLGVVVFLSVKTLPELVRILNDAKVPAPALTLNVMWFGQLLAHCWMELIGLIILVAVPLALAPTLMRKLPWRTPAFIRWLPRLMERLSPKVIATMAVGELSLSLAELIRSGVPMVEALRVIAPTARSLRLRSQLLSAAHRVEQGEELSAALDDGRWFDAEFRRLLDIGQASGELDQMLDRLGHRYQRQARRLIDRLATLLEPVVILSLALLVGVVVMAAILPLLRLQEII